MDGIASFVETKGNIYVGVSRNMFACVLMKRIVLKGTIKFRYSWSLELLFTSCASKHVMDLLCQTGDILKTAL